MWENQHAAEVLVFLSLCEKWGGERFNCQERSTVHINLEKLYPAAFRFAHESQRRATSIGLDRWVDFRSWGSIFVTPSRIREPCDLCAIGGQSRVCALRERSLGLSAAHGKIQRLMRPEKLRRLRLRGFFGNALSFMQHVKDSEMSISTSFLMKTLNLERTVIKSVNPTVHKVRLAGEEQEQNCIEVDVQIDSPWEHKCPHCMKDCNVYDHQSGEVVWRALGINGTPVFLKYGPARISCPEHGVVREYIPWADGRSWFTADFNNDVAWMALQLPKSAIATFFQISWPTVGNCIKAAHGRVDRNYLSRIDGLVRLCIDVICYARDAGILLWSTIWIVIAPFGFMKATASGFLRISVRN